MTLLFKIHYFLWYGGITSILSYESVYARYYTNASTIQFGTLRMILPFIAVGVTPIVCLNADRRRKHRLYFTVSLIVALFSLMAFTLLPLTMLIDELESSNSTAKGEQTTTTHRAYRWVGDKSPWKLEPKSGEQDTGLWVTPFVFFCLVASLFELAMAINICLSDSYAVLVAEESATTFGRIIVWGTFGWAFSALVLSLINRHAIIARLLPGLLFGVSMLSIDSVLVSLWSRDQDFKLDFISVEAARSLTGSSSSGHREPTDYMPMNEANLINMGTEVVTKSMQETKLRRRRRYRRSSEISLDRYDPQKTVLMMNQFQRDVAASRMATPKSPLRTRSGSPTSMSPRSPLPPNLNSPVAASPRSPLADNGPPSGVSSAIKTINSDYVDPHVPEIEPEEIANPYARPDRVAKSPLEEFIDLNKLVPIEGGAPGPLNSNSFQGGYEGASTYGDEKKPRLTASLKIQLTLFYLILKRRKSLIRFLIMFVLSGVFMSMQWNYFFLYLETIYRNDFELISALSMVGQSILGELPFFILSRRIIEHFGRSHTISISMICTGSRFLLYRYMLSRDTCMYYTFVADIFQGPTYGLFYVVMTEVGLEYSYCDDTTLGQLIEMGLLEGANAVQVDAVRLALRSTVQSVAFACYEGLGVGLGGLIGGVILQHYNFETLWFWMAICAISLGLVNILIEMHCRESDLSTSDDNTRAPIDAEPPPRLDSDLYMNKDLQT